MNSDIELVLEDNGQSSEEIQAQQVPKSPTLILDSQQKEGGVDVSKLDTKKDIASIANAARPDDSDLSAEEKKIVADFVSQIDITNSTQVLQYGSSAQKKVSSFSENALSSVKSKDMEEVGDMISDLVVELKGFAPGEEEKKGFLGFFKKQTNKLDAMKNRYQSVEHNVDKICDALEEHQRVLMKDVAMLDQMYDLNLQYYKELTMYILAGRDKLAQVIQNELPQLQNKAKESGRPEDAQAANQLAEMCNRFDKKLHDLELSRVVSIQMGPQVRLVQNTNTIMVEKIQSSLVNTIPLWKNQMVLTLGMQHSQSAIKAQREVTDVTNKLLKDNADMLKINTIEATKESERSIVDIETLQHTNQQLISTLDEVMQIQRDGRQKRREAEVELSKIEDELKAKLLEARDESQSQEVVAPNKN